MSNEWAFTQDCTNGGTLTYRCISLGLTSDEDEFTDGELETINDMVKCLNENFVELCVDDDD